MRRETIYIALWVIIFSVLMQAVYLIVSFWIPGFWNYTVLLGNLLGAAAAVLNFLLMGITVQKALLREEKDAKNLLRMSQTYRMFGLIAVAVIGIAAPCFDMWSVVIPLLFPRVAVAIRPLFKNL